MLEVKIKTKSELGLENFENVIKEELNVKNVTLENTEEELEVELDLKMTPELEHDGFAREITRKVQALRKTADLIKEDKINLEIISEFNKKLENQVDFIKERVGAAEISLEEKSQKYSHSEVGKIKGNSFEIKISKV